MTTAPMRKPTITRQEFAGPARTCLHQGRWCNADCWLVQSDGAWVVKDFRKLPFVLRWTLGVWLAKREYGFLLKLSGLGYTPGDPALLDGLALAERFVEGRPLKAFSPGSLPVSFFEALEAQVRDMHTREIVHLDLRNAGNIVVRPDGQPVLLDFQSAVSTARLPAAVRHLMEKVDLSGIYKHWAILAPDTMGQGREQVLLWQIRARKWWRVRGYQLVSVRQRRLKPFEVSLLKKHGSA